MTITTRNILAGSAAAGAVAGAPAVAGAADDDLLALCQDFHQAKARHLHLGERFRAAMKRAENHPDCPPLVAPVDDREAFERRVAFQESFEEPGATYDDFDAAAVDTGHVVREVFATPAQTVAGLAEKLAVLFAIYCDGYGGRSSYDENDAILAYQDDPPWLAMVVEDANRLAGRAS